MKSAKKWLDEKTQSGPFDLVRSLTEAEQFVREIQADALEHAARASVTEPSLGKAVEGIMADARKLRKAEGGSQKAETSLI